MENPKLSECTADGLMTGDCPALASSLVNGRPPDTVPVVVSGPAFERPGSPLAADNQRDSKKIRKQCSNNINGEISKETSKKGLFGPWIVVDTRRRRPQTAKSVHKEVEQNNGQIIGS
ncbi:hypothetical protein V6N13_114060 [Hibiscus sabdariffa]